MSVPDFISEYQPPQDFPSIIYAQATGANMILFTWNILLTIMVLYVAFRFYQLFALIPILAVTRAISPSHSPPPQRCQIDPYIQILLNLIVIVLLSQLLAKGMIRLCRYFVARNHFASFSPTSSPSNNPTVSLINTHHTLGRNSGSRPENTVYDIGAFRSLQRIDRSDNLVR
jgi:hypothetical protein